MPNNTQNRFKLFIFGLIGVFNTLFDIVLYVIFYNLSHSIVLANVVATSIALTGSYFLNSRLTFKSKQWTKKTFVLFVLITVTGLWFLQTIVIYLLSSVVLHIPETVWSATGPLEHTLKTVAPKLLATAVTLVWNYLWYNYVIFKSDPNERRERLASETL